nr:EOG090X051L [Leptodora kindtii]
MKREADELDGAVDAENGGPFRHSGSSHWSSEEADSSDLETHEQSPNPASADCQKDEDEEAVFYIIFFYYRLVCIYLRLTKRERGRGQSLQRKCFIPCTENSFSERLAPLTADFPPDISNIDVRFLTSFRLPGHSAKEVKDIAELYLKLGETDWSGGALSGGVYNFDKEVNDLITQVYGMTAWTNPLHPDVFPGIRKMEAEIVQMGADMFHGGPGTCGTMTSGGTESLLLACKAYRDYAREKKGIKWPEIVCAVSAHAAIDKAAHYFRMRLVRVPVDPVTQKADVNAMKKAITRNTCMLIASAPGFPHGVMDPISEIAALGRKYDIPVHVDACLGGFVIAFMEEAGFTIPPFDFRVDGVTSISVDTHKYGYAPKGTSIILYSNPEYRHHQFFVAPNWTGGIYATPTISGSRPGALIATCWAALMYYGRDGYVKATKRLCETHRFIEQGLRNINGIQVMGHPEACVVAIQSSEFNIYKLSDGMSRRGWSLNPLQFPFSIHICVTYLHTHEGVAERFLNDIQEAVTEILENPSEDAGGSAAIYGMSQSIPDRSMVSDICSIFLDTLYNLDSAPKTKESDHLHQE